MAWLARGVGGRLLTPFKKGIFESMKPTVFRLCIFLAILTHSVLLPWSIKAQVTERGLVLIKNFGTKDYKSHPRNFSIVQDQKGIIYVGNAYGLLQYDGSTWKKINLHNGLSISNLYVNTENKLLIGSPGTFGIIKPDINGTMVYQKIFDYKEVPLLKSEIYQILEWKEELLLFSKSLLVVLEKNTFKLKKEIPIPSIIFKAWDKGENLIIHDFKNYFQYANETLLEDTNFDRNTTQYKFNPNCSIKLSDGNQLIGSTYEGLFLTNASGQVIRNFNKTIGLANNHINAILEDKNGNLWVATDNGVSYIEINSPFRYFNETNGVEGLGYASMMWNNKIFLGTSQGLYFQSLDSFNNQVQPVDNLRGQIWCLTSNKEAMLIGHAEGLFSWKNGTTSLIKPLKNVWTIVKHPTKEILVVGHENGLSFMRYTNGQWIFQEASYSFNEPARIINWHSDSSVWVCHGNKGLFKVDFKNDLGSVANVQHFKLDQMDFYPAGLTKTKQGIIFYGDKGFYKYVEATGTFEPIQYLNDYLGSNNYIDQLSEDQFQNLWILLEGEIRLLNPLANGQYSLLQENIISNANINLVGSYEHINSISEEEVIVGVQDGFIAFNNKNLIDKSLAKAKAQIGFSALSFYALEQDSLVHGGKLDSAAIPSLYPVEIPYELNNIKFSVYTSYYYESDEKNYYYELIQNGKRLRVSGWTKNNQYEFTDLREGQYAVKINSANLTMQYPAQAYFRFTILPPWYRTFLAYVAYSIAFSLLLVGIVIAVLQRFRNQKKKAEKALANKDDEIRKLQLISEKEKLELEVREKNKELGSIILQVSHKNEFINQLKRKLHALIVNSDDQNQENITQLIKTIDQDMMLDSNWKLFELQFDQTHQNFLQKLQSIHPQLSKTSKKMCAFIRMNLSSKEIALMMNISVAGVEKRRYRLRKALELNKDENLNHYINGL